MDGTKWIPNDEAKLLREEYMNNAPALMSKGHVLAFGTYLIILNLMLVYVLVKIWPGSVSLGDGGDVSFLFSRMRFHPSQESRYLLIVALTGALGSYIHLATSFSDFLGNRRLYSSWSWWYVLRPFIGMALALILYFTVRGGVIADSVATQNLNLYGIAAISGMAGMFSKQAADKLREIFENLFKTEKPPERSDKLTG